MTDIQKAARSGGNYRVQLRGFSSFVGGGTWAGFIFDPSPEQLMQWESELRQQQQQMQQPTSAPAVQPNAWESMMQQVMMKRMGRMIDEMDEPTGHKGHPGDSLSDEDRVTLALAKNSGMLGAVFGNLASAVQQGAAAPPTGILDKIGNAIAASPQVQGRLITLVDRISARILPATNPDVPALDEGEPEEDDAAAAPEEFVLLLDALIPRMLDKAKIAPGEAWLQELDSKYPAAFEKMRDIMINFPVDEIISYINAQENPLHMWAFKAPQARGWVIQLQNFCKAEKGKES